MRSSWLRCFISKNLEIFQVVAVERFHSTSGYLGPRGNWNSHTNRQGMVVGKLLCKTDVDVAWASLDPSKISLENGRGSITSYCLRTFAPIDCFCASLLFLRIVTQIHTPRHTQSRSRASFPLTSGRKTRALGASLSGMRHRYHRCRLRTAQWNRISRIQLFPLLFQNGYSLSSRFPTAGQGERSSGNEIAAYTGARAKK